MDGFEVTKQIVQLNALAFQNGWKLVIELMNKLKEQHQLALDSVEHVKGKDSRKSSYLRKIQEKSLYGANTLFAVAEQLEEYLLKFEEDFNDSTLGSQLSLISTAQCDSECLEAIDEGPPKITSQFESTDLLPQCDSKCQERPPTQCSGTISNSEEVAKPQFTAEDPESDEDEVETPEPPKSLQLNPSTEEFVPKAITVLSSDDCVNEGDTSSGDMVETNVRTVSPQMVRSSSSEYFSATEKTRRRKLKKVRKEEVVKNGHGDGNVGSGDRKVGGSDVNIASGDSKVGRPAAFDHGQEIKPCQLPKLNVLCGLSSFVNPSEFYIQTIDVNPDFLSSMTDQLNEYGNQVFKRFKSKQEAKETLGRYCLTYDQSYNSWYRAEVLEWIDCIPCTTDNVHVQLIDFGDHRIVPYTKLRVLPDCFRTLPRMAVRCHLANMYPPGSTKDSLERSWPKKTIDFFEGIIQNADVFRLVYMEEQRNSLAVDLVLEDETDVTKTLCNYLVAERMGSQVHVDGRTIVRNAFMREQLKTAQGLSGITDDMTPEQKLERFCSNVGSSEYGNLDEAMTSYAAKDDARICRFTRPDGTCFKGPNCRLEHTQKRKDGFTTDKREVFYQAKNHLHYPEPNEIVKIFVTYVNDINDFYAQLESGRESFNELLRSLRREDRKFKPYTLLPAMGEIVLAKQDKKWLRAMVKEVYSGVERDLVVQVFLVDTGEVQDNALDEIAEITKDDLVLPFQAVRFRLSNIAPNREADISLRKEHFEEQYLATTLSAHVLSVFGDEGPYRHTTLSYMEVRVFNDENRDITDDFVNEGFAVPSDESLMPNATETLLVD